MLLGVVCCVFDVVVRCLLWFVEGCLLVVVCCCVLFVVRKVLLVDCLVDV